MKKIILVITMLLSSFSFSQDKLEGVWQQKENKDNILIIYVEENNIQFYNYKLNEEFHINEQVVNVSDNHLHTTYSNLIEDFTYDLYYNLKNKNTLIRGSEELKTEIIFKRID
jgi:hypothetical protein